MNAIVKYQVATYEGTVCVYCEPDDENELIIAKAKKIVTRLAGGSLPYGSQSWKVVERSQAT